MASHVRADGVRTAEEKGARPKKGKAGRPARVPKAQYEAELIRLQIELAHLKDWVVAAGRRVVVIFEGRDAAGKGGTIQRITEFLSPRTVRTVALGVPTERERTQWYFQRYVVHLPAAGEIVLFDRSWYNRAGVEHVMGFCTKREYRLFLDQAPAFEKMLVDDGIILLKYWFSVSDREQEKRFQSRAEDPLRRWKLSPMDLEARRRWVDYSRAKDEMFARTDSALTPWWVVEADDKRAARLNCIHHLLSSVPYVIPREQREQPPIELPKRGKDGGYVRPPLERFRHVPDHAASLTSAM